MSASNLRVQVRVAGRVRADLTFPTATTAMISEFIPPDVAAQLPARGIDPAAIAERAIAAGLPVGELFALESEGGKQVRVWLE